MTIAWIYLDKKAAVIDALKDYSSMAYILQNHSDDLEETAGKLTAMRSSAPTGIPRVKDPRASETRLAATLDEIDVLKERYRRALEYMEWFKPAWDAMSSLSCRSSITTRTYGRPMPLPASATASILSVLQLTKRKTVLWSG